MTSSGDLITLDDKQAFSRDKVPRIGQGPKFKLGRDTVISAGQSLLTAFDRLLTRFATTEERQIFPNELFPWTSYLEANWSVIRDEAQNLLRDRKLVPSFREISPDHKKIAVDDKWRLFFLRAYGVRIGENCARCPE